MGCLFAVGSICFALGSLPAFFTIVAATIVAWVFFVGSLFFTTAAAVQFREAVVAAGGRRTHGPDWRAGAVQLAGTLLFNLSTFAATRQDLASDQERHLIWAPDLWGSVCFLVASLIAWHAVLRPKRGRTPDRIGARIAMVNLAGSVAFGLAAVGARYLPTTGEPANIALVNLGTFVGAVCFLVGAVLLPVQSAAAERRRV